MNYSFFLELDLDLKTLSESMATIEELLIAFTESTSKQKEMHGTSYKLELVLQQTNDSVCPEREQKPNTLA